ncbi:hypothetical protein HBI03_107450 [Parastagonospora nodorum]|nr:hypothetical protein HBI03_107450 [Parastagonospora nodorum]
MSTEVSQSMAAAMSRPQIGIDRLPARRVSNEPREAMNCKSCRKRKVARVVVPSEWKARSDWRAVGVTEFEEGVCCGTWDGVGWFEGEGIGWRRGWKRGDRGSGFGKGRQKGEGTRPRQNSCLPLPNEESVKR